MQKFNELPDMEKMMAKRQRQSPAWGAPPALAAASGPAALVLISESKMRCGGCGAKVGATTLSRALARVEAPGRPEVLVGVESADDAAVVRVPDGHVSVQTVDFFRTFLDDPYTLGRVAAVHAMGDCWAMGAEPHAALAIAQVPFGLEEKVEEDLFQMMSGAAAALREAGCALAGGHSSEGHEMALGARGSNRSCFSRLSTPHLPAAPPPSRTARPGMEITRATLPPGRRDALPCVFSRLFRPRRGETRGDAPQVRPAAGPRAGSHQARRDGGGLRRGHARQGARAGGGGGSAEHAAGERARGGGAARPRVQRRDGCHRVRASGPPGARRAGPRFTRTCPCACGETCLTQGNRCPLFFPQVEMCKASGARCALQRCARARLRAAKSVWRADGALPFLSPIPRRAVLRLDSVPVLPGAVELSVRDAFLS